MTSNFKYGSNTKGTLQDQFGMYNPTSSGKTPGDIGFSDNRAYTRTMQPGMSVRTRLEDMVGSDSSYMTNARQRGLEAAAARGNINSSISAGAAERAALEAALPVASQDAQTEFAIGSENLNALNQNLMQERQIGNQLVSDHLAASTQSGIAAANNAAALQRQRENLAFTGEQRGLDRAHDVETMERSYQHDLGRIGAEYTYRDAFANNDTFRQNWLNDQAFTREFTGTLAMLPIVSQQQFLNTIGQQMIMEPDVWTPEAADAITGFFSQMMPFFLNDMMSRMFGPGGG